MYIKDMFEKKKPVVAIEIFPPKLNVPLNNVIETSAAMAKYSPDYMSVTYGAGGTTADNTVKIASHLQNKLGMTALAHLTCVCMTKEKIHSVLHELKQNNISNILALRGDFPPDYSEVEKDKMQYRYAYQLVEEIRNFGGFCIGGACYPEGHVENENKESDIDNLKYKLDAGIDFFITQLFFDNNMLYSFLYRLAAKGLNLPVVAGFMPVTNAKQIKRMCGLSGATLTPKFKAIIDKFYDKPEALKQAGIAYATEQIIDLISNGVSGIHIYSMNKPEIAGKIMENISEIVG